MFSIRTQKHKDRKRGTSLPVGEVSSHRVKTEISNLHISMLNCMDHYIIALSIHIYNYVPSKNYSNFKTLIIVQILLINSPSKMSHNAMPNNLF